MQILPSLTPSFLYFVLVELQQHQTHSFFFLVISLLSELGMPLTEKLVAEKIVAEKIVAEKHVTEMVVLGP
jgi:hypothetical protein